jgi:gluconate 2-dehydrogenase gamma chain
MHDDHVSRRTFLARGAAVGALAAAAPVEAGARTISGEIPWAPGEANAPTPVTTDPAYVFFDPDEAAFIEAAVSRLIPADELGPGAREVGVPLFIDRQLAGEWGRGERWYMQGPWRDGTASQGFQSRLDPQQIYRAGIAGADEWCRQQRKKRFAELAPPDQDAVLAELEDGKAKIDGVDADAFFKLLLLNTTQGFFADPIYGGNKDMAGWRMIGFPGARYDYRDFVGKHGEKFPLPPVGLKGRPAWTAKS